MTSAPDREVTYSTLPGSLSAAGISRRRPGSSQRHGAALAPEHKTVSRTDGSDREDLLKKESFTNVRFGPHTTELLRYLAERGISSDVAVPNCREVRYTLHGKRYFAIGFRNVSDGYELRNRFFKASLSPKDISLMDNGSEHATSSRGLLTAFRGWNSVWDMETTILC